MPPILLPAGFTNFAVQYLNKSFMATTFENKKIIVVGGSSGIGLATAKLFAEAKALVTVTGRSSEKLKTAQAMGLQTAQVDSAKAADVQTFFKKQGKLDHLIIALGGSKGAGLFSELSIPSLREGFEEKFFPQLNTLQAALPYLNEGSSVTLVTAISATAKIPGVSGLGAINGALEIMVPILAKELKTIRINAVSPGVVDTPWWDFLPAATKQETFNHYAAQITVGRIAQADEIANAIVFLAGNAYMTGKVVACDGGM